MQCGGDMVLGLLFADDTSLVASDREGLTKSLDVLVNWCEDQCGEVRHNAYEEEDSREV